MSRGMKAVKLLGVTGFCFWIGKESKHPKWQRLTGPEKLHVSGKHSQRSIAFYQYAQKRQQVKKSC